MLKNAGCLREGPHLEQDPSLAGQDFDLVACLQQLDRLGLQRLLLLPPPPLSSLVPKGGWDQIEDPLQAPHGHPPLLGPNHYVRKDSLGQNSVGDVVGRDGVPDAPQHVRRVERR